MSRAQVSEYPENAARWLVEKRGTKMALLYASALAKPLVQTTRGNEFWSAVLLWIEALPETPEPPNPKARYNNQNARASSSSGETP